MWVWTDARDTSYKRVAACCEEANVASGPMKGGGFPN